MTTDNILVYNPTIENIIEITTIFTQLKMLDDRLNELDFNTMKYNIIDWANEFEEAFGGMDWNSIEEDYILMIHDFAVRKILRYIGCGNKEIQPLMETEWVWGF